MSAHSFVTLLMFNKSVCGRAASCWCFIQLRVAFCVREHSVAPWNHSRWSQCENILLCSGTECLEWIAEQNHALGNKTQNSEELCLCCILFLSHWSPSWCPYAWTFFFLMEVGIFNYLGQNLEAGLRFRLITLGFKIFFSRGMHTGKSAQFKMENFVLTSWLSATVGWRLPLKPSLHSVSWLKKLELPATNGLFIFTLLKRGVCHLDVSSW